MKIKFLLIPLLLLPSLGGKLFSEETMHSWTDTQGRTLQASFVSLTGTTLTIRMNGEDFPLDLSYFDSASQALAKKLASPPTPPAVPKPAPATPKPKPSPPKGELSLDSEHEWSSSTGTKISAKFLSLDGENVNLSMYNGRAERTIPLDRLSNNSQTLAKKLQGLVAKRKKMQSQLANKRKNMKVPDLQPEDLENYLSWTSVDGNNIEAAFVDASSSGVVVMMKQNPNRPIEIPWERLSPDSQALGEGLRRLKEKLKPKNPTISPYAEGKKNSNGLYVSGAKLPRYAEGKWKGYNTVLESALYDVALNSNGKSLRVWLKNESKSENSAVGERADRNPLIIYFRAWYDPDPKNKSHDWKDRQIVKFSEPPLASMERESTTWTGTMENGATFEYNMEINHKGLSFWGEVDESRSEKFPTSLSIAFYSPNFIPDVVNMSLKEIEPIVGDGSLYIDPMEAKRQKIPMMNKWSDVMAKFKGAEWNPIKSAELMGKPFGSHQIKVTPASTRGMYFTWSKGYSGVFPFQGIHLSHRTEDAYNARRSPDPGDFKDRLEIPKTKRLLVNIIRGRG